MKVYLAKHGGSGATLAALERAEAKRLLSFTDGAKQVVIDQIMGRARLVPKPVRGIYQRPPSVRGLV